ncbi:MAG TPA: hypothetical protein VE954_18080 [Oligoflexus sp.]|uniref:hypothetical protein n=1 Tax=Oligoflexus sp. TaxID=1971216 RepID=UPI002D33A8E0|nr:hypothetical protein [Oligoflexus sp.]HYX35009.1 hypothetical protein [Oligoflexus sp.]
MKRTLISLFMILTAFTLNACATAANPWAMTVDHNNLPEFKDQNELKAAVGIDAVQGGDKTNPLWVSNISNEDFKVALNQSLKNFGYANEQGDSRYKLDVTLLSVDQPLIGLDMTVKITARYVLTERQSKQAVFDQQIFAQQTATFGDAALGFDRLKIANERAGKESILQFLKKLQELGIKAQAISMQ